MTPASVRTRAIGGVLLQKLRQMAAVITAQKQHEAHSQRPTSPGHRSRGLAAPVAGIAANKTAQSLAARHSWSTTVRRSPPHSEHLMGRGDKAPGLRQATALRVHSPEPPKAVLPRNVRALLTTRPLTSRRLRSRSTGSPAAQLRQSAGVTAQAAEIGLQTSMSP